MLKINIDLSESDLDNLIEVLDSYLSDLSPEIADTDSQEYRDKLKLKRTSLMKILEQLNKQKSPDNK